MTLRQHLLAVALAAVIVVPAFAIGARNDARPAKQASAYVTASPQDMENAISSACNGLAGLDRHQCVYDVVARNRRISGTTTN
jgi:hypothetical protein